MFRVIRDLLKYDRRFRIAMIFLGAVLLMAFLSFFSPYDPNQSFVVPMDAPPSPEYFFGTNSRGQDIFWWMTFAVRNSLLLGVISAVISRVIAILVGLTAGYQGGWLDKILMVVGAHGGRRPAGCHLPYRSQRHRGRAGGQDRAPRQRTPTRPVERRSDG